MPTLAEEVQDALVKGIILHNSQGPNRILGDGQWARDTLVWRQLLGLRSNSDGLRHRLVLHSKAKGLDIRRITMVRIVSLLGAVLENEIT